MTSRSCSTLSRVIFRFRPLSDLRFLINDVVRVVLFRRIADCFDWFIPFMMDSRHSNHGDFGKGCSVSEVADRNSQIPRWMFGIFSTLINIRMSNPIR